VKITIPRPLRTIIAAALSALAIAASPALASGAKPPKDTLLPPALRDSFPAAASYPYSTAQKCTDSALTARIYDAFTERTGLKGDKWPDATYEVWIAAPHPFIESLLPGALCVTVHTASPIRKDGGAGHSEQFIYFHERYWEPRIANGLASEVGLNYDSSAALTRAKLAVVLAGFQDLSRTWRRWPGEFSRHLSPDTAIPALTFLKATKVKGFEGRPFNDGFLIEMLVGGKRTHVFVLMTTPDKWGRTYPTSLWGGGLNQGMDMPRLPEPTDTNATSGPDTLRPEPRRGHVYVDPPPDIPIVPADRLDAKPQLLSVPTPTYPEIARKAGIEGQAVVEVLVDTNGTVVDARILKSSGNSLLDASAMGAARGARFTPPKIRGKVVRAFMPIRFQFTKSGEVSWTTD
jgi:TonB family protein